MDDFQEWMETIEIDGATYVGREEWDGDELRVVYHDGDFSVAGRWFGWEDAALAWRIAEDRLREAVVERQV